MKQLLSLFVCHLCFYSVRAQKLSHADKKECRTVLKTLNERDQQYRIVMRDSPQLNTDSVWRLLTENDSLNRLEFKRLLAKFGYPSVASVHGENPLPMLLHFTLATDFLELEPVLKKQLEQGNLPPRDYAWWYDRCQRNQELPIYFGQYTNETFCGELLETYNTRRASIGLEALKAGSNCE